MKSLKSLCKLLVFSMVVLLAIPIKGVGATKKIALNKSSVTLSVGKTVQLKVTGTKKEVKWSSSKKSVATVSVKGKVKAKKAGNAKITAKVAGKKLVCKICVKSKAAATSTPSAAPAVNATLEPSETPTPDVTSEPSETPTSDVTPVPSETPTPDATPVPSETPTKKTYTFRNDGLLQQHFEKHGKDMGYATPEEYVLGANRVIASPEALHKLEAEDGDDVYYLERTNEFVIVSTDGYIRTYFLPDSGINYFNKQSRRILYYELCLHRYQQSF